MRFEKLDPALVTALSGAVTDNRYTVFLHTDSVPDATSQEAFSGLSSHPTRVGNNVYTATLSRDDVDALSDKSWVKYLRLSQKLRPVERQDG
jgi:hypothetical protein